VNAGRFTDRSDGCPLFIWDDDEAANELKLDPSFVFWESLVATSSTGCGSVD